jgi:hypothetical protein
MQFGCVRVEINGIKKRAVVAPASDDKAMNAALSTETVDNSVHSGSMKSRKRLSSAGGITNRS